MAFSRLRLLMIDCLRQPGADALEVLKWKELYDNLEHALDECEDVMNVLESISLKNG